MVVVDRSSRLLKIVITSTFILNYKVMTLQIAVFVICVMLEI